MTDEPGGDPVCPSCGEPLVAIQLQIVRSGAAIKDPKNGHKFVMVNEEQRIADARCGACGVKITKNLKKMGVKILCRG